MLSRRSFLGAAAVVPLASSIPLAVTGQRAALPLKLVNETGAHDSGSITFYIVGTDLSNDAGTQVRVTPDGAMAPVSTSDNGGDGFADYAIPFGDLQIPGDMSGRIYFAIGDKLKFKVNDGDQLAHPAGWVDTDPNYGILYDCVEFTYKEGRMYCNTTMVDMFSVPFRIDLAGDGDPSTGQLVDGGRAKIFEGVRNEPDFAGLVVEDRRIIAPGHGIEAGLFPTDYFDPYVNEVWSAYESQTMTVNANNATFTGQVQDGQFVFDGEVQPFAKPTTKDVLFCDGALSAPNDGVTGPVAAVLGSGFNRSTLASHTDQPTTDPATFYQTPVSNHYAKVMHANSADGKAYGFAFDDVAGFASYIEANATTMSVTLTPF